MSDPHKLLERPRIGLTRVRGSVVTAVSYERESIHSEVLHWQVPLGRFGSFFFSFFLENLPHNGAAERETSPRFTRLTLGTRHNPIGRFDLFQRDCRFMLPLIFFLIRRFALETLTKENVPMVPFISY